MLWFEWKRMSSGWVLVRCSRCVRAPISTWFPPCDAPFPVCKNFKPVKWNIRYYFLATVTLCMVNHVRNSASCVSAISNIKCWPISCVCYIKMAHELQTCGSWVRIDVRTSNESQICDITITIILVIATRALDMNQTLVDGLSVAPAIYEQVSLLRVR